MSPVQSHQPRVPGATFTYYFSSTKMSSEGAEAYCEKRKSRLAEFHNREEFIKVTLIAKGPKFGIT